MQQPFCQLPSWETVRLFALLQHLCKPDSWWQQLVLDFRQFDKSSFSFPAIHFTSCNDTCHKQILSAVACKLNSTSWSKNTIRLLLKWSFQGKSEAIPTIHQWLREPGNVIHMEALRYKRANKEKVFLSIWKPLLDIWWTSQLQCIHLDVIRSC